MTLPTRQVLRLAVAAAALSLAWCQPAGTVTLLPLGSTWKYWDKYALPAGDISWTTATYGSGTWATGPAPLGYGNYSGIRTTISMGPSPTVRYTDSYYRASFTASMQPGWGGNLTLSCAMSDGAIIYLNGVEAARVNMPGGTGLSVLLGPTVTTYTNGSRMITQTLSPSVLLNGTNAVNWVAVSLHQHTATPVNSIMDLGIAVAILPTPSPSSTNTGTATATPSKSLTSSATPTRSPSPPPIPSGPEQVHFTDVWKYKDDGVDMTGVYQTTTYSDVAWKTGRALLGTSCGRCWKGRV